MAMQKMRPYRGPALFSYGFRPFFLFGVVYAGAMIPLWLAVCAALDPGHSVPLLMVSGIAWAVAFFGFAVAYAPLLCRARKF